MRTLNRDEAVSSTVLGGALALDVSSELLGDSTVNAKDEAKFLRVGGEFGSRDVRNGEGMRLAVEVRTSEEIETPCNRRISKMGQFRRFSKKGRTRTERDVGVRSRLPVALEGNRELDGTVADRGGSTDHRLADEEAGVDEVDGVPNETSDALEGEDRYRGINGVVGDRAVVPAVSVDGG
jgi:hypothetical protein